MPVLRRIGINALYLIPGRVGGTEIYLRNFLPALAEIDHRNQYFVFTNRETGSDLCPRAPNFIHAGSPVPARFRAARLLWEQTGLPAQTLRHGIDVLFSPGFSSPVFCRGSRVTVIHDLQHKRQPGNFGVIERLAWDAMVAVSVRRSDILVTVSDNSRNDLIEIYGSDPAKVRVIRHGVEPEFFRLAGNPDYDTALLREAGVPACRYLLAVSTLHPHKNWSRLLETFSALVQAGREEHLVVAGLRGKASRAVEKQIQEKHLEPWVHLVGWQPRKVLMGLFKFADVLVFPSTFEGFGMPVAEAMAAGVPVACSDIAPLREIAAGAAEFFDPSSTGDMRRTLERVLDDDELRTRMAEQGREKARRLTWPAAAEQTLAVLLEAAHGSKG